MTEHAHRRIWPALALATGCIIAGGLVSAVSAHAATQSASWAAAYLVLVGGVGTGGLALGRALLSRGDPSARRLAIECVTWVLGNVLVLTGTLGAPRWFVDVGSAALVGALASILHGVWRGPGGRGLRGLFLVLVIVLVVSIPVGVALSHVRG